MYSESPDNHEQTSVGTSFWNDGRRRAQSVFSPAPTLDTEQDNAEITAAALSGDDELDVDQKITQKLLEAEETSRVRAASVPEPLVMSNAPYPYPEVDLSESDPGLSPAALFLSSFSPRSESAKLPDDEGEVVCGYTLGPIVGYGGFSTIRRAFSPTGGTVAVKIVRKADIYKQDNPDLAKAHLDHERQVWSSLNHEHILPLFASSHTSYADFFITLYCPAGSLFDILKRDGRPALPQDDAGMMFRQVVRGLRYLHEVAGIVHRDMKLENVLVDETGVCKIGDFGMARKIGCIDDEPPPSPPYGDEQDSSERSHTRLRHHSSLRTPRSDGNRYNSLLPIHVSLMRHHSGPRHRNSNPLPSSSEPLPVSYQPGSLPYAAPELLLPQNTCHPRPDPAQDIWALGIMLYALLTGRLPFADSFEPRLQMKILHGVYQVPEGIGRGAERVLQGCLERSVPDRWTIAMVDEVAWGVGWGAAGDAAALSSPTRPCLCMNRLPEENESERSLPASRSRSRRSRSRTDSAVRSASRNASRSSVHPYHAAHLHHHHNHAIPPSLTDGILRSFSSSSSSSSSSFPSSEAALNLSPDRFGYDGERRYERGRPLLARIHNSNIHSSSRSPSPPRTPIDTHLEAEQDRGRKPSPRYFGSSPSKHPFLQRDLDATSPLKTTDDYTPARVQWPLSPADTDLSLHQEPSSESMSRDKRSFNPRQSAVDTPYDGRQKSRSGSMPPASASGAESWRLGIPTSRRSEGSSARTPDARLATAAPTRSRSVGFKVELLERRCSPGLMLEG